jgi:hypothetical protein
MRIMRIRANVRTDSHKRELSYLLEPFLEPYLKAPDLGLDIGPPDLCIMLQDKFSHAWVRLVLLFSQELINVRIVVID